MRNVGGIRSLCTPLFWFVLLGYGGFALSLAIRHGLFTWGALGEYSLYPYLLLLGLFCSGIVFIRQRVDSLKSVFILLFFAYGQALMSIVPVSQHPVDLRVLFDFVAYTTAFAVITAGMSLFNPQRAG